MRLSLKNKSKRQNKKKRRRRRKRGRGRERGRMEKLTLQNKSSGIFLIVDHSPCVPPAENHANAGQFLTALTMKKEKSQGRVV